MLNHLCDPTYTLLLYTDIALVSCIVEYNKSCSNRFETLVERHLIFNLRVSFVFQAAMHLSTFSYPFVWTWTIDFSYVQLKGCMSVKIF